MTFKKSGSMKRFHQGKVDYTITLNTSPAGRYKVERTGYRGKTVRYFSEAPVYDWCDDDDYIGVEKEKHKAAKKFIIDLFKKKEV